MNEYWVQGFEKQCQARGVDPHSLIKWADEPGRITRHGLAGVYSGARLGAAGGLLVGGLMLAAGMRGRGRGVMRIGRNLAIPARASAETALAGAGIGAGVGLTDGVLASGGRYLFSRLRGKPISWSEANK